MAKFSVGEMVIYARYPESVGPLQPELLVQVKPGDLVEIVRVGWQPPADRFFDYRFQTAAGHMWAAHEYQLRKRPEDEQTQYIPAVTLDIFKVKQPNPSLTTA